VRKKSIKTAVLVPLLIVLLIGFAALVVTARLLSANIADRLTIERTTGAAMAVKAQLAGIEDKARVVAAAGAGNHAVISAVTAWNSATSDARREQSRQTLITYLNVLASETGADSFIIRDKDGYTILRLHAVDNFGDHDGSPAASAALEGRANSGFSSTATMAMGLNAAAPIWHEGEIIGVFAPLFFLHTDDFVDDFAETFGVNVAFYRGDVTDTPFTRVASTFRDLSGQRVIGDAMPAHIVKHIFEDREPGYTSEETLFGYPYRTYYLPMPNMAGVPVGAIVVGFSTAYRAGALFQLSILLLSISAALLFVISIIVYRLVSSKLSKLPLITKAAEQISMGDIEISGLNDDYDDTNNEVILLERAFSRMIESFKKQAYILARIAEGDYTSKVEVRCEKDVINLAIEIMLKETLSVLKQVADAGVQVSDGSREIAAGAQLLADGAAQQSATVEQLSASMSEMARMTKENAGKADQAANLAHKIKDNAEKGSGQMAEMIQAVKEINEASQSISKVIKIIDDIAFQTNILALNAAVEAARAGSHGKGFAVVAEEVRNLAAKSAEAAKDTGKMISDSMQKAELGSRIASETAASLEEIVSGIVESNQIVSEIAAHSNEQTTSIAQIDGAISQVAEVIHQNSATAEQSAAASDEMKSQSAALEELIMQFQLRDQNKYV
jgi:methyl-accepting chemotaxis protein